MIHGMVAMAKEKIDYLSVQEFIVSWNSFPSLCRKGGGLLILLQFSKISYAPILYEFVRVAQNNFSRVDYLGRL